MATIPTEASVAIGQKLTAAKWNTDVGAAVLFLLNPPTCRIRSVAAQTVTTALYTFAFELEDYDTDGLHVTTPGSNTTVTIVTPGIYTAKLNVEFTTAGASTFRDVRIMKNGALMAYTRQPTSTANQAIPLSGEFACLAGDVITFGSTSTAANSTTNTSSYSCVATVRWVSK